MKQGTTHQQQSQPSPLKTIRMTLANREGANRKISVPGQAPPQLAGHTGAGATGEAELKL